MQPEAQSTQVDSVEAHPVSELLACPPETGILLAGTARSLNVDAGEVIFRQSTACEGLYLVISGQLLRRTERLDTRLVLGTSRSGDLVELAAVLGDCRHTYSLVAQTSASLLMLPIDSLQRAFEKHPPLRMKLLEELAREVSRAYRSCSISKMVRSRRRSMSAIL